MLFIGLAVALPAAAKPLTKAEANQVIPEGVYSVKSGRRVHHPAGSRAVARKAPAAKPAKKPAKKSAKKSAKKVVKTKSRASRSIASVPKRGKKSAKSGTKRGSKRVSKHAAKRGQKHETKHAKKTSRSSSRRQAAKPSRRRFPVARETPNERDMPFVSIPHRKVSRHDRTIVMDDPAVRSPLPEPRAPEPELKPDATALTTPEGEPAEVRRAKAEMAPPPIVGPAPASVTETPPAVAVAPSMPEISAVPPEAAAAAEARENGREPDAFDLHSGADPLSK